MPPTFIPDLGQELLLDSTLANDNIQQAYNKHIKATSSNVENKPTNQVSHSAHHSSCSLKSFEVL